MKRTIILYMIGIIAVTSTLFGPLIYREFPPRKFEVKEYNYGLLPDFDFHVKKSDEIILHNANAALDDVYNIGTPSVNFPPISASLKNLWLNRGLASSNSHELYIHSLFIVWDLFYAYEITDNLQYLEKAKQVIVSWIRNNDRWRVTLSQFAWNDHATSERTIVILYLWDYLSQKGLSDQHFDDLIERYCIQTATYLVNPQNYITGHNHGIFEDIALLLISFHIASEKISSYFADISAKRFQQQIDYAFSERSIHLENSPGYHFVVTNLAQFYLNLAALEISVPASINDKLAKAQSLKGLLLMPDGILPPIGDTNPNDKIANIVRLTNTSFVDSLAGYYIISTSDQYLFARSTSISKIHLHDDPLSFIYSVYDGLIFDETGFLSYENTPDKDYTKSYLAHNVIFPSFEESTFNKQAFIRETAYSDSFYVGKLQLLSEFGSIYRTFVLDDENDILEIIDYADNTEKNKWTALFMLSKEIENLKQLDSFNIEFNLNGIPYHLKSSDPIRLETAEEDPKIGWKAKILDGLHPTTTIVKEFNNNQISKLSVQKKSSIAIEESETSERFKQVDLISFQTGDFIDQRPKPLWGTQYYRRLQIYLKLILLLGLSFLAVFILFKIKFLHKLNLIIALVPNLLALAAVLYVVLRHIN